MVLKIEDGCFVFLQSLSKVEEDLHAMCRFCMVQITFMAEAVERQLIYQPFPVLNERIFEVFTFSN